MRPRADDEARSLACHGSRPLAANRGVVLQVGREHQVVPAGDDQRRDAHLAVPVRDRQRARELVGFRVTEDLEEEGHEALVAGPRRRERRKRAVPDNAVEAVDVVDEAQQRRDEAGRPALGADDRREADRLQRPHRERAEQERAAAPQVVGDKVVGRGRRGDRAERVRRPCGRVPRRGAHVGHAVRADAPVALRQPGGPTDSVVAVVALVAVGEEPLALGRPARSHVLDGHDEAGLGRPDRIERHRRERPERLAVRRALDEHGVPFVVVRAKEVGAQYGAVAHRRRDVALDADVHAPARCASRAPAAASPPSA